MGLLLKKNLENGSVIGLWRMEEEPLFFAQQLELQAVELEELAKLKGRRQLEWLASRYLVHLMLVGQGIPDRLPVLKDEFGKPHIYGSPYQLSFSHSHDLVAVILSDKLTGIDVQAIVPKIEMLAKKFLREVELASLKMETKLPHLHVYWGAKEALYKAHGRKQLDFREHIHVQPFAFQRAGSTTGTVEKDGESLNFEIFYEEFWGYVLVWCYLT